MLLTGFNKLPRPYQIRLFNLFKDYNTWILNVNKVKIEPKYSHALYDELFGWFETRRTEIIFDSVIDKDLVPRVSGMVLVPAKTSKA